MGFSNTEGKRLYFKVEEGFFHLFKGKGVEDEPYDTVDGELEFLALITEQAPGYSAADKLVIALRDGDEVALIKSGQKSVFSRMFASYIASIEKDQRIRIRVREGSKGKVTTCFIDAWSSGDWHKVPYEKIDGTPEQMLERAVAAIRSHPAFNPDYVAPRSGQAESAAATSAAAMGPEQQRMLVTINRHGYPAFAPNTPAYMAVFRRVLKVNDLAYGDMSEPQFAYFADQFEKVAADKTRWPRELTAIPAEYDPFADE